MPVKKYFIALVLPEPAFGAVEALKHRLQKDYGLKGALRSPAHITLHRPFEWKEEKEQDLIRKLEDFSPETSFDIELKNFAFFEPRVIYVDVLQNPALNHLHNLLTQFAKRELKLFNEADDLRGFHPHVTIANRDLKKQQFYELESLFKNKTFSGRFGYAGLSLLRLDKTWKIIRTFGA